MKERGFYEAKDSEEHPRGEKLGLQNTRGSYTKEKGIIHYSIWVVWNIR